MNHFSAWLRQFFGRIGASFRNFMSGRYGTDKLNMVILGSGVLVSLIASFIRLPVVMLLLTMLSYALLIWALFRSLLPEHLQALRRKSALRAVLRPAQGPAAPVL